MFSNPVGWFEIYVQDMSRAIKFYEAVFDTKLQQLNAPFPEIELWSFARVENQYGANGALVKMTGVPSGGNSTIVYFHCLDCAFESSRVLEAGGQVMRPKMGIGEYGFISLVIDTEGNMIGLHSMQ
jgi:predicted enzyme related to lactoylglutathione lyase